MNLNLQNQVALVTASTGGIGLEIARTLAGEGASVHVNGRTLGGVMAAIEDIRKTHPKAHVYPLVADNSTAKGCEVTLEVLPSVTILVNNLGIYEATGFFDETDADWHRILEANVMSGVRLTRHYLKGMLERGAGRVVFVSSESGVVPAPEMPHYSATKATQISIARSLAELTKGTGVTVNSVLPGPTRTEGVEKFIREVFPELSPGEGEREFMKVNRPASLIQRLIDPAEIAAVVAFLCSSHGAIINGAAVRAEGGLIRSML